MLEHGSAPSIVQVLSFRASLPAAGPSPLPS